MSQQIQITGGAKVRDLQDVIIGTSGVLSSVAFDVANGVPRLDSNGKILVSQLPNSVMEYKGTWNAATNTPTLANGTGNQGDVYLCNVAGTVNFGAGPIAFIVGDSAVYSGSIWQRSGGATGSVTSVGLSTNGGAITIGNSPITTSGVISANFNGTNLQYVNGAGNLTTFPTLITSIGLSMPSAFSVANSPLTANGTIAVTGAGYASQYIRGDGTLADFPSSGGGGSSVSYYLNGGTSQGTIGGTTYYEMSKTADTGTGVDFTKSGDGFIVAFLTDANDPALLNIPAGNWNYEIYASMSANGGTPQMYAELYKYDGTTFTLISTSSNEILYDGTNLNLYTFGMTVPATTLTLTDRLAIKLYATNSGGKTTTVHTQDSHLCQIITTFSTGITALNGLTAQVQYFQTGTSGTDFNISSTTATHTFNIPDASATARGLITTGTQTIAGTKTFSDATKNNGGIFLQNASSGSLAGYMNIGGLTNGVKFTSGGGVSNTFTLPSATGYTFTFPNATGTIALTSDLTGYVTSVTASLPLSSSGGTTPNITISQATTSTDGYLSSTDFNTFNNKISGSGTAGYLTKYTGSGNTIGNSGLYDDGTTVSLISRALSGSSASFSSTLTSGDIFYLGTGGLGGGYWTWNATDSYIYSPATKALHLYVNDTTTNGLTIAVGGASTFSSSVTATSFIKTSGTSSQFLKADGSVDSSTYLTTSAAASTYLPLTGGTLTGALGGTSATFSGNLTLSTIGTYIYTYGRFATSGGNILFANGTGENLILAETATNVYSFGKGSAGVAPTSNVLSLNVSTGAATFSSSVIAANYRSNGRIFVTDEASYGDMTSTAGMVSIGYDPTGQEATIRSRNYSTSTNTKLAFDASQYTFGGGNVLIGTTTDSGYKLDVNGTGRFSGALTATQFNVSTSGGATQIYNTGGGHTVITNATANKDMNYQVSGTGGHYFLGAATFSSSVRGTGFYTSSSFRNYLEPSAIRLAAPNDMSVLDVSIDNSKIYIGSNYYSGGSYLPISLYAGNFTQLYLNTTGNVLIGDTTDYSYKLYVNGGSSNGMLFYSTSAANQIKAAGTAPAITFSNTITSATIGGSLGACTSANQFLTGTAAGDMILINQFTGNKLYITNYSGGVYLTQGATSWTANSDIRLKNINSYIENAVEKLSTLQTINFSYKDDKTNKQNLGLIAQEVEKIFPELIDKNGDGMLGVRYTELVPVLIKAVQELKLEIETLKNK